MLKHIKLGINEVFYFNYEGYPLPLRPISSYELDDSIYNSLIFADPKVAELAVKLKLGLVKGTGKITYNSESYAKLKKYYDDIDYWVVYHAMKDFQKEEFSRPDYDNGGIPYGIYEVKKMNHIHEMARKIQGYSYQPKDVIEEIVKSDDGKVLAKIVFYLNQPLCENFGDMTKLQRDFLAYSKIEENGSSKRRILKSGDKVKLGELVGNVNTDRSVVD